MVYLTEIKGKKEKTMIVIILILLTALFVPAASSAPRQTRSSTDNNSNKDVDEFPYGTDPMGRYISNLDRNSKVGAKIFLDSIPMEKTYEKKKLGNHTYETVSWVETGEDRIKNGGRMI